MKCPHCGHGHGLHSAVGALKSTPGTCHQRNAGEPACTGPGWLPEINKPQTVVSFPGRSRRSHGPEWISPLDERADYSGWDDAA
jgi:hypothetical protein